MSRDDNRDFSGSVERNTAGTFNAGPMGMSRDSMHDHSRRDPSGGFARTGSPPYGASGSRAERNGRMTRDPFENERALGRYQAFQSDEEHHEHHAGLGEQIAHGWQDLKESFTGKGPKNYVRSDGRIHEECCEHLAHDSFVDASDIDVTVSEGEVTLAGTVDSKEQKRRAEVVIEHLRGVHDVHNQLRVRRTDQTPFSKRPL